ncbi:uncharacterized protein LOC117642812 [Thrips palmi]|uniref:Uncharacterized protein LOC117642812 n=1 Tax=Thrips palmi TaxID=161013 RepID=A0A6P8YT77_THRPL|nr:uncharacterized protein LOC117642812 [Thrips palmi]
MLERGECDVALAPYNLDTRRVAALQPSAEVTQDSFKVHVRCGVTRVGSDSATVLLHGSALAMLFGGLLMVLVVQLISNRSALGEAGVSSRPDFWTLLFDNWSTLTEVPLPRRTSSASLRALFGSWLFFVLTVNVALKSQLTAETTKAAPVTRINALVELQDSKVTVLGYSNSRSVVEAVDAMGFGGDKSLFCEDDTVEPCLTRFESDDGFAVLRSVAMPSSMKCLRGCYYVVDESVIIASIVFFMRRHDPLGQRLSDTVLALRASGIMDHWQDLHRLRRTTVSRNPAAGPDGGISLRLAAVAWSMGLTVATAVAIFEVLWWRLHHRHGF